MQRNMGKGVISFAYAVIWINLFLCSHGKCYSSITNIFKECFYGRAFIQSFMFNKFTMRECFLVNASNPSTLKLSVSRSSRWHEIIAGTPRNLNKNETFRQLGAHINTHGPFWFVNHLCDFLSGIIFIVVAILTRRAERKYEKRIHNVINLWCGDN